MTLQTPEGLVPDVYNSTWHVAVRKNSLLLPKKEYFFKFLSF
jgi:hypothetical protein